MEGDLLLAGPFTLQVVECNLLLAGVAPPNLSAFLPGRTEVGQLEVGMTRQRTCKAFASVAGSS
jgi:hypothetical protein